MDSFTKNFGIVVILLLGLLALDQLPGFLGRTRTRHYIQKVIEEMHNADLNREDFNALAAGYYEGLRKDAGPSAGMPIESDDVSFRDDFLRYELKPNVKRSYSAGMRITNSLGMSNPEYTYQKPSDTRRIALLGDSMSLGPYAHDYITLLERRLNQAFLTPEIRRFQILNFAVYGYSVLQMMDVALEKAPKFHPDVYIVALTNLELIGDAAWRTHIARLILSGTDLKYDFIKRIVAQAGIRSDDHLPTIRKRLEPFFNQVMRWAVEQIRDHASAQGARTIIVLVASPINPNFTASDFNSIRHPLDGIGVPIIDLRDTFRSRNLDDVQVQPTVDFHPNALGHELIFHNLWDKLQEQPDVLTALVGH
jgi:hypothetical protein